MGNLTEALEEPSLDDLTNQLPDDILCHIVSSLSIDEAVRSSIISKRWKTLWKHASRLDFDATHMINPLSTKLEKKSQYGNIVRSTIRNHLSDLNSCRFKHLADININNVEDWVEFLLNENNKRLSSLILECVPSSSVLNETVEVRFQPKIFSKLCSLELTNYKLHSSATSAFECCDELRILKLKKMRMENGTIDGVLKNCSVLEKFSLVESSGFDKLEIRNSRLKFLELLWLIVNEIDVYVEDLQVVVLDSLICPSKGLRIYSQGLRSFSSCCNPIADSIQINCLGQRVLKTRDILENCSDLFESQTTNIFRNILTLSIELNLNNIREALALSYILRSCIYLNTLEITIPVKEASDSSGTSNVCSLPFPESMFWERHQIYNCFNHKLKFVAVRGFTGKEQEVKFVKHLITRAIMIEKISVICDSSIIDEATSLLSLRRASVYLSIILLKSESKNHAMEVKEVQEKLSCLKGTYNNNNNNNNNNNM